LEEGEVTAGKGMFVSWRFLFLGTRIWVFMLYGEREEVNRTDQEGLWAVSSMD
jgi:hypothetical protein